MPKPHHISIYTLSVTQSATQVSLPFDHIILPIKHFPPYCDLNQCTSGGSECAVTINPSWRLSQITVPLFSSSQLILEMILDTRMPISKHSVPDCVPPCLAHTLTTSNHSSLLQMPLLSASAWSSQRKIITVGLSDAVWDWRKCRSGRKMGRGMEETWEWVR